MDIRKVYKYEVPVGGRATHRIPDDVGLMKVDFQWKLEQSTGMWSPVGVVWLSVPEDVDNIVKDEMGSEWEEMQFWIIPTGGKFDDDSETYLGSFIVQERGTKPFVGHVISDTYIEPV